jgi:isoquinoline 1-oxidoreductase subunit alpha
MWELMMQTSTIRWTLNRQGMTYAGDAEQPLLWHLRDELGLTGTKYGCGVGLCGSCTVHVNGRPQRACTAPMAQLAGQHVVTIEGLATGDRLHAVQQAWMELNVPQCGYCQSGQMMATAALLAQNPRPSAAAIDEALRNHLCRCGTYARIKAAALRAAALLARAPSGAGREPA